MSVSLCNKKTKKTFSHILITLKTYVFDFYCLQHVIFKYSFQFSFFLCREKRFVLSTFKTKKELNVVLREA